jgi:hypothetical protein
MNSKLMKTKALILATLTTSLAAVPALADDIVPVRSDDGRLIYMVESELPKVPTKRVKPKQTAKYVYWSKSERRWKPVKPASPAAVDAARSAAAEVSDFVATKPQTVAGSTSTVTLENPGYTRISQGRQVRSDEIDTVIEEAASRHNVDPNLVRAIVKVESNFNPRAVSHKGAMGLMQLMPATARSLNVSNPFDPHQNVEAGVRHFRHLLNNFNGDVSLSLAAYNAGQGAVERNGGIPPYRETRNYVRQITDLYANGGGNMTVATTGKRAADPGITRSLDAEPIRKQGSEGGSLVFSNVE